MNHTLNSNYLYEVYKSLFENNFVACYALDTKGNIMLMNDAALEVTGYTREEGMQISIPTLVQEDCLEYVLSNFESTLLGNRVNFNASIKHKSGAQVELNITAIPIILENRVIGVMGMAKDITEADMLELVVNGQNKVLELMAKGCPLSEVLDEIVFLIENVSNGGRCSILLVDEEKTKLVLGSASHLPSESNREINRLPIGPKEGSCGTSTYLKKSISVSDISNDPLWEKYRDIAMSNGLRACWSTPLFDNNQQVLGTFAIYYDSPRTPNDSDVRIIKKAANLASTAIRCYKAEEKINFLAYYDELTGLPNRRLFDRLLKKAVENKKASKLMLGLIFLDLDQFKLINDTLGHKMGNLLLKDVASRLQECLRLNDIVSRQGGDEFTILLDDVSKQKLCEIAQKVVDELAKPFFVQGFEIFITPSIGISIYPHDGKNVDDLLRKADIAMYEAKKAGRNNYQFYHAIMDKQTNERVEIENELRKALDRNEFSLHYQPIVSISTGKLTSVEALIRWNHPAMGNVSPAKFIPIAEETGLIVSIGEWVLRTACHQLILWDRAGLPLKSISVNISIRQFYQPNLIHMIESILTETALNPKRLTIEITESMTMDVETATNILAALKGLGIKISMDDFGTGYSSLSHLHKFPIDYLKIDQSFTRNVSVKGGEKMAITILQMAHNLGLKVVAEGVETNEQVEILQKYNCHEAQGYLFSKPIPPEEMSSFLLPVSL